MEFFFFENSISGIQSFYFCPDVPVDLIRDFFFNFKISSRKSQKQQKLAKKIRLYKFSRKHVSVWFQKEYLHCIISWHPRTAFLKHFESKCLYISIYLLKKILFPRHRDIVMFYLVGGRTGGDWINFLRRFAVWALQNVL